MVISAVKSLKSLVQPLDGIIAESRENKKNKNRGGIKGITMNQNSRTRHFLAAPVLESITNQMFDLGGHTTKSSTKYHQLNHAYIR